jgi:biopolymer transport protein ExbD
MAWKRARSTISAEPNLTPILDMVFQLITFFMLVISFKTAAMDPGIRLPVAGSARPKTSETERNFAVLNIDASGRLRVYGEAHDLESYLAMEAVALRETAKAATSAATQADMSLAAVIRADRATPFTELNRVLAACKKHGFRNVTFKILDAEPQ